MRIDAAEGDEPDDNDGARDPGGEDRRGITDEQWDKGDGADEYEQQRQPRLPETLEGRAPAADDAADLAKLGGNAAALTDRGHDRRLSHPAQRQYVNDPR